MASKTINAGINTLIATESSIAVSDGWSRRTASLTGAQARELRDFLVANVKDEDLLDKFKALSVGDQFTLLSDKNAARGTVPSKAIKVDENTYFSYKHSKLNKADAVLAGKPGTITKN